MDVVDSHAHFWDVETIDYPWIEPGSPFDRSFSLSDYQAASSGVPVTRMVFVECDAHPGHSLKEAKWVAGLAERDPRIQGLVPRVSFMSDDWEATLDSLAAMPLVRGIRDNIQNNPEGFALRDRFVAGVKAVHSQGLHFELCLKHHQLAETVELVRRCPDGPFVLDHCAKPDIAAGLREPWHTQIRELASLPNVVCKISGLVTEADWARWTPEEVLWYARAAAEAFGRDRIMFGSDWPVNEVAGGYKAWFHIAQTLVGQWGEEEQRAFFCSNAERIYRIGKVV